MAQWETKTLAKAAQLRPPVAEARRKLAQDASVSFVPMEDLGIDEKFLRPKQTRPLRDVAGSYTYFADGDVLLAKITPCFENGKLGIAGGLTNGVGFGSSEYVVLRPGRDLSPDWLYYYLSREAFRFEGAGQMAGAVGHRRVAKDFIENYPIPVPPIGDQLRIVGTLDEAFAAIATARANTEQNLRNARELLESHLDAIFSRRGPGWVDTTLEHVLATQPRNGWSPPTANHSASGIPVLTLSSVTGFQFRGDKVKFTSAKTNAGRHYWVQNGDLLITRSNTPQLVGHVAIASGIKEPTVYPDLIMRMVPASDRILTEFLYYQMRTSSLRGEITGRAQGASTTMKKITKGAVQSLPIVVPPVPDQKDIVGQLKSLSSETEHLVSIYERKLAALDALKQSLLHQAFTGAL